MFIKTIKISLVLLFLLVASSSHAENRKLKIHSTDSAAAGYTDVAVYGPANLALDKINNGFVALSINAQGTLSEGLGVVDWLHDVADFKESFDTVFEVLLQYDKLLELVFRPDWDLEASVRIDLMKFSFSNKKLGHLSVGAYAESSVGFLIHAPRQEDIKIVGTHIDIGKQTDVFIGKGFADGGIEIGYGRAIELPHKMSLGVGIQNRLFYRFSAPDHVVVFDKELRNESSISIPDITYHHGWGFGMDLFSSLDLNDPYLDSRFSIEARNIVSAIVYDEFSERDMILVGFGVSINPLKVLSLDGFKVLSDVEVYEDGLASLHVGALWKFGNQRFHFTPSIGGAMLKRDVWGNQHNSFTVGFSTKVAVLELAGVFEYVDSGRYDAGTRVALAW